MDIFYSKYNKLPGTSYQEIKRQVDFLFTGIRKKTKRRPYLRSAYFGKEKIFFEYFWMHLSSKNFKDRLRRLKFLAVSLDLIKNSRSMPAVIEANNKTEIYYRFPGKTKDGELFWVQIKENKKIRQKFFISCFPEK
jgi:hypothetical protein